jgi:hypothetical protein
MPSKATDALVVSEDEVTLTAQAESAFQGRHREKELPLAV